MSFDVFDLFEGVLNTLDYADSASPKNKIKKILFYLTIVILTFTFYFWLQRVKEPFGFIEYSVLLVISFIFASLSLSLVIGICYLFIKLIKIIF